MSYLIILLAIGVVLGPLVAVLPSRRQRHLASLREQAARTGLSVRLRTLPEVPPRFRFEPTGELACYEVSRDPRQARTWQPGLFIQTEAGWQSRDVGHSAPAVLADLPAGAQLVALGWDTLSVFWNEEGGESAMMAIADVLKELRDSQ